MWTEWKHCPSQGNHILRVFWYSISRAAKKVDKISDPGWHLYLVSRIRIQCRKRLLLFSPLTHATRIPRLVIISTHPRDDHHFIAESPRYFWGLLNDCFSLVFTKIHLLFFLLCFCIQPPPPLRRAFFFCQKIIKKKLIQSPVRCCHMQHWNSTVGVYMDDQALCPKWISLYPLVTLKFS